jgi:DNA (cytosine-5)-methyltransferase 1
VRIGSLFSGYGGLDLAVAAHYNATVAWHVEYDAAPSKILDHHWPDIPNYGDVTGVDFGAVEPVDILTAGYPCQPFSHAGNRKGAEDERHLWPHVLRAIGEMGPRLAILENVRGHLTLGFDCVLADLADVGWSARWGVVRACDAGACHQRARLFIIAHPSHLGHEWGGSPRQRRPQSSDQRSSPAADAGGERYGPREDRGMVGRVGAAAAGVGRQASATREVAGDRGATDWGPYGPAITRWEHITGRAAPEPTQPGRNGQPRLSPRFVEWMMGLPDGWVTDPAIGISHNNQLKALGNGVVPQQAKLALEMLTA